MDNKPFFSIVMPIYGVEPYLRQAIDSVLNQTFQDFELLLVDDKSPDGCPQICDTYAEQDARVKVIHKPENQGLGMARNTGLEQASGEYVLFMDSDDTIHTDTLSTVQNALTPLTEIAVFGITRVHENVEGQVIRTEDFPCQPTVGTTLRNSGEIFIQLNEAHVFPYAWNKVYLRDFLMNAGARFESTKLIEDFLFNIAVFAKAEHITVLPDCLYYYRKPAHQTLANTYSPQFYDLAKRKFHLELEFLQITDNVFFDARQTVLYAHIKHIVSVFLRNKSKSANLSGKDQRAAIRAILNDDATQSALTEYLPKSTAQKMLCLMLKRKMVWACYAVITMVSWIKKI